MESTNDTPKKRGRKPLGDRPMTTAEAKRRSREKMRAEGAKDFLLNVGPRHMVWVRHLAEQQGISEASALHIVLNNALEYFGAVRMTLAMMRVAGVSPEECNRFEEAHWPIQPPTMPETLIKAVEATE